MRWVFGIVVVLAVLAPVALWFSALDVTYPKEVEYYTGKRFAVAGHESSGLCAMLNEGHTCEAVTLNESVVLKRLQCGFDTLTKGQCELPRTPLSDVTSGKIDLAVIEPESLKADSPIKVLFYSSPSKQYMVVARPDLPLADGEYIAEKLEEFLSGEAMKKMDGFVRQMLHMPDLPKRQENLYAYIAFEGDYHLHEGVANYLLKGLEEPMAITYGTFGCGCNVKNCVSVSDVAVENYEAALKLSKVGNSITPYLLVGLESKNSRVAAGAAYALAKMCDVDGTKVVPALLKALSYPDDEVKEQVLGALTEIKPVFRDVVQALAELSQQKRMERPPFFNSKAGFRFPGSPQINQLPISSQAAKSLGRIAPEASLALFQRMLVQGDPDKQLNAIYGLGAIADKAFFDENEKVLDEHLTALEAFKASDGKERPRRREIDPELFPESAKKAIAILDTQRDVGDKERQDLVRMYVGRYPRKSYTTADVERAANVIISFLQDTTGKQNDRAQRNIVSAAWDDISKAGKAADIPLVYQLLELAATSDYNQTAVRIATKFADSAIFPSELITHFIEAGPKEQWTLDLILKLASARPDVRPAIVENLKERAAKNGSICQNWNCIRVFHGVGSW